MTLWFGSTESLKMSLFHYSCFIWYNIGTVMGYIYKEFGIFYFKIILPDKWWGNCSQPCYAQ